MTEEEKDLDKFKTDLTKLYEDFSSKVRQILVLGPSALKQRGWKSVGDALMSTAVEHKKAVESLADNHLRKYPD